MSTTQTKTPLDHAEFDTFIAQQLCLKPDANSGLKTICDITCVNDFVDKNDDDWKMVATTLLKPPGRLSAVSGNEGDANYRAPQLIPAVPITLSITSLKRCKKALKAAWYHHVCGWEFTVENMDWDIIKQIAKQIKVNDKRKKSSQETKIVSIKNNDMCQWVEILVPLFEAIITERKLPLAYFTRGYQIPPTPPDLLTDKPYSGEYGLVNSELIHLAKWDHILLKQEEAILYNYIAIAWKDSHAKNVLSGKIFTQKQGSAAYNQGVKQYASTNKRENMQDNAIKELAARKYSGTGKYTLELHVTFHVDSFNKLESSSQYVNVILPNEEAHVSSLLSSIEFNDSKLTACMEYISADRTMLTDFDKMVNFLIPACPVK